MTDAGEKLLDMVPAFIGLGVASKFLEKTANVTQSKKSGLEPIRWR